MHSIIQSRTRRHMQLLEIVTLLLVLVLAAWLRLSNVATSPAWYADEGSHLNIAQNLAKGQVQYLAVRDSTLLFARLPLFEALFAVLLKIAGGGIATLRLFTGSLGLVSVGLLYWVIRRTQQGQNGHLALLAALMLAVYPHAVLYSRFGFSYNLLTPLVLVVLVGLWEYMNAAGRGQAGKAWLALAALAAGLGTVSDLWMFSMAVPLAIVILATRPRDLFWAAPLLLAPFALYTGWMLGTHSSAFWFDLRFSLSRLNRLALDTQIKTLALNYAVLLSSGFWVPLGVVGLFLLQPVRLRRLALLLFFVPLVLLGRTVPLYHLSFYYNIPLLPFVAIGLAALVQAALLHMIPILRDDLRALAGRLAIPVRPALLHAGAGAVLLVLMAVPLVASTAEILRLAQGSFSTEIDPFLINPQQAQEAAEFLNNRLQADDLVIASPALAWLVRSRAADYEMAVAAAGRETPLLPGNIPAERFAFDPRYTGARYVVVDNLWQNLAMQNVPGVAEMVHEVETWPLVFQAGAVRVYSHPTDSP